MKQEARFKIDPFPISKSNSPKLLFCLKKPNWLLQLNILSPSSRIEVEFKKAGQKEMENCFKKAAETTRDKCKIPHLVRNHKLQSHSGQKMLEY